MSAAKNQYKKHYEGLLVQVLTTATVSAADGDGDSMRTNLPFQGFFIDEDYETVDIGEEDGIVTCTINKDHIISVNIMGEDVDEDAPAREKMN